MELQVSVVDTHFHVIAPRAPEFIYQESRDESKESTCVCLIPVLHFLQSRVQALR